MDQGKANDFESLHEDVADYEDVVEGRGGGKQPGAERLGAQVGGGGVVVCFSMAQGDDEEGW